MTSPCAACAALPSDVPPVIAWPSPQSADEWARDDRLRGALFGLAVGDALGAIAHAGGDVPADPAPGSLRAGGATQLSLFTGEALLRMYVRLVAKGIGPAFSVIRHGLDRWMYTQGHHVKSSFAAHAEAWPDGWLVRDHRLHRRVEGFSATVSALRVDSDPSEGMAETHALVRPPNSSTGAGGLVRSAAAGLLFGPEDATLVGAISSSYTHGGADGYLAAGALSRILAGLLTGEDPGTAADDARRDLGSWPASGPVSDALGGGSGHQGTSAARALAIGFHYASFVNPDDPTTTVLRAIAAGGTSAGIVAGTLAGVRFGASGLPGWWLSSSEVADVVEEITRACSTANRAWTMQRPIPGYDTWPDGPFDEHPACALFWPRFPGW